MRTLTPTRPHVTSSEQHRAPRGIEPSPRRSQHRVLPLHQKRRLHTQAEEEGLEPSPPDRAAAFSKRVRRNRYSPLFQVLPFAFCLLPFAFSYAPARNRTWTSSFARSRGHPFHHGDSTLVIHHISPPGLEPGTQRSKRRMIIHFNTGMFFVFFSLLTSSKECPYLRRPPRLEPNRRVPRLHRRTPSSPALAGPAKIKQTKNPEDLPGFGAWCPS